MDDFAGRRAGSQCGREVWALAEKYFDGSAAKTPIAMAMRSLNPTQCELRFNTLRGFYYKLQSTPDLSQPFTDDPAGFTRAFDSSLVRVESASDPRRFYRVLAAIEP